MPSHFLIYTPGRSAVKQRKGKAMNTELMYVEIEDVRTRRSELECLFPEVSVECDQEAYDHLGSAVQAALALDLGLPPKVLASLQSRPERLYELLRNVAEAKNVNLSAYINEAFLSSQVSELSGFDMSRYSRGLVKCRTPRVERLLKDLD